MTDTIDSKTPASGALDVFQPRPDVLYSLEATAHLARVPRRSILVYCRAGLLRPVFQQPYGIMAFTEEAIYAIRRIEDLRTTHGLGVRWIKSMFDLVDEVAHLRAEVRFYRNR